MSELESFEPTAEDLPLADKALAQPEATLPPEEEKKELQIVKDFAREVKQAGGRALIVGGYARDEAMRRAGQKVEPKDIDVEVYQLDPDKVTTILEDFKDYAKPNLVGKSFGVIKLGPIDISFPRRETKVGTGHRGFDIVVDPDLSIADAARRRDLTINSIALDPLTWEIVDPHHGLRDLENKILQAVDLRTFGEDPLRVLRLAGFAGRFGFTIEEETKKIAQGLPLSELPNARVGEEWRKLLLKSEKPSIGLEAMRELLVLEKLHPELAALVGLEQEPDWHPEGDVWTHTRLSTDVAAEIVRREGLKGDEALVLLAGTVLHDLGKAATTEVRVVRGEHRVTSYGHTDAGIEPARHFLAKMEFGEDINRQIYPLIRWHLYLESVQELTDSGIRRLSTRLKPATIQQLAWVIEADKRGRGTAPKGLDKLLELTKKARELGVEKKPVEPIIRGRDLLELGLEPGRSFGEIIRACQEAYLNGEIKSKEEAIKMAKRIASGGEKPGQ